MSDYVDRMRDELDQLQDRISKLRVFIGDENTGVFPTLQPRDQAEMFVQVSFMQSYLGILSSRYSRALSKEVRGAP